ncbi:unnamed protein product, partial [Callosobruchus maculatus]
SFFFFFFFLPASPPAIPLACGINCKISANSSSTFSITAVLTVTSLSFITVPAVKPFVSDRFNHTEGSNFKHSQKLPVSTVGFPKCAGTSSDQTDRYKRRDRGTCTSKNEDPQECDFEEQMFKL